MEEEALIEAHLTEGIGRIKGLKEKEVGFFGNDDEEVGVKERWNGW